MERKKPLRGYVVLVVEDDPSVLEVVTIMVADVLGCDVLAASSGLDALGIIDSGEHVDLLFSDIEMPNMDGLALTRVVRERLPQLPIVLTTGLPTAIDLATEYGAVALMKPYSVRRLEAIFREQLHLPRTRR